MLYWLERHGVTPDKGEILVTGLLVVWGVLPSVFLQSSATPSLALAGARLSDYIKSLGASEVLERSAFASAGKPLGRERWAGAVRCRQEPYAGQRVRRN